MKVNEEKTTTQKWSTHRYIEEHPEVDYKKIETLCERYSYLYYMLFGNVYPKPKGTRPGIEKEWLDLGVVKTAEEVGEMLSEFHKVQNELLGVDFEEVHTAWCLYNNKRQRVHRIKPRLLAVEEHSKNKKGKVRGLFLTLTFNDAFLQATTFSERRAIVIKFVQSTGAHYYVGNVDYGKKNGREHYHFVVDVSKVDPHEYMNLTMGSDIDFERIKGSLVDENQIDTETKKCIGAYLVKLTNHSIKSTTKNSRIIYSKSLKGYKP